MSTSSIDFRKPQNMLAVAVAAFALFLIFQSDGTTIRPEGTAALNKAGFTRAVNMEQGIQGWASAGLPVKKP